MAVNDLLIDTNAYVAFKRGVPTAIDIVQRATRLAFPTIVLGELLGGFAVGSKETANRTELQQFLSFPRVHILMIDELTSDYYALYIAS